ncbi:MAG: GNAT family N-acetyltransferase [Flavobacterium sp.]|uniref:GNAT family N-acetyltransferase n=1 Tax=Flavobacterium sp. TaxID=239 RepID=UPI0011FCF440|nr:GNAT family N-acetyltransferase [Flavobacterium sp.]RZJ64494.1 MAG: GNAT family N-acetyltransferase [Flavobacterium sp.]
MPNYTIKKFEPSDTNVWNAFVSKSKNGTFLFDRGFMDYHSDRFQDFSLLVYDENELLALLPAHKIDDKVHSHFGLTYGGFVLGEKIKLKEVIWALQAVLKFLSENGIGTFRVKLIPSIYHLFSSDELPYALFVADAKLYRRDSLSVIDLTKPFSISKTRRESIRRGAKNNLEIREESNFKLFWDEILIPNLDKKHEVKPVHSIAEIELLHKRFPENIRHFNVYDNGKIVAGTTVFVSQNVAHPQYISGNDHKNELGSLDYLYHFLITDVFKDAPFFDFGISNEDQGRKLNEGLVFWKESFGAKTVVQDFYEVATANHKLLENVLI